jgi:trimeric autotransporter adhesin
MKFSNYISVAAWLCLSTSVMAQTTPPSETPLVTVGADTKLLIFDWDAVPGATYYQLYVNPDGASGYTPTGNHIAAPGTRAGYSIAAHLQHWQTAKYKVAACNAAGCRNSKALFPRRHMLETIGYFKASNTGPDLFGHEVELSLDGNTLAVVAPLEASNATGVNGNQSNNSFTHNSGAVYVYRRVGGQWRQEAYLKAPDNVDGRNFGGSSVDQRALGLSSDGSTLAVGAPGAGAGDAPGEVVIFTRASSGTWSVASTLLSPEAQAGDAFGLSVDLSGDGRTLKVVSLVADSSGTPNADARTHIFVRPDSVWEHQQTIALSGVPCRWARMSGNGNMLVVYCFSAGNSSSIATYTRSGSTWSQANVFSISPGKAQAFALDYNGKTLAALAPYDNSQQLFMLRWNGVGWNIEQSISPPARNDDRSSNWGYSIAFNQAGTLLAVGSDDVAPPSPAGISETVPTGTATHDGAVFVYGRQGGTPRWAFRSVVKAPNPDAGDLFGNSVALSASGSTLAIGALQERSKAKGINGNQADDSLAQAGAVYLY